MFTKETFNKPKAAKITLGGFYFFSISQLLIHLCPRVLKRHGAVEDKFLWS